jgi:hypothetical protein
LAVFHEDFHILENALIIIGVSLISTTMLIFKLLLNQLLESCVVEEQRAIRGDDVGLVHDVGLEVG